MKNQKYHSSATGIVSPAPAVGYHALEPAFGAQLDAMKKTLPKGPKQQHPPRSRQEPNSPPLLAVRIGEYLIACFSAIFRTDGKLEVLYGAIPSEREGICRVPFSWSKVGLNAGEKLVRLMVESSYGIVRFRLAPVMGKASLKTTSVLPPLAVESNATACALLGKFLGVRVEPELPVKASLRRLVPEEAVRLLDVEGARDHLKVIPPPVRDVLLDMGRLVADVRGLDPVTGMRVSAAATAEIQREVLRAAQELDEAKLSQKWEEQAEEVAS